MVRKILFMAFSRVMSFEHGPHDDHMVLACLSTTIYSIQIHFLDHYFNCIRRHITVLPCCPLRVRTASLRGTARAPRVYATPPDCLRANHGTLDDLLWPASRATAKRLARKGLVPYLTLLLASSQDVLVVVVQPMKFVRRPERHWRELSSSLFSLSSKLAANLKRSKDLAL